MNALPEMVQHWLSRMALHDDKRAFRAFFEHFYRDAYRVALFHVQDHETAEELTSDVFLKLWDRRSSLVGVSHPRTYLLVSIKNHCLNHLRKQPVLSVSITDEAIFREPNYGDNPEQQVVWDEMQQTLNDAVSALPPRCGLIFQMVRDSQLSYREVAEALGITPKTVEIQMGIALKRLGQIAQTMGVGSASVVIALLFSYFFS
nr:MAG: RNA polymerase sigma-70 factor [Cytophagales bacterium]